MILRDKCVILHMPKTGGVFMRMLLEKYYGDDVQLASGKGFDDPSAPTAQHHTLADVGPELAHLPVFGFIRNPWDWYVSWYHFFMSYPYRPPHFITVSRDKSLEFPQFIESLYSFPKDSLEYLENSFSAEYYRIFGCSEAQPRNPRVAMGRYETVHDDLHRFLSTVGVAQECLDEVSTFRKMNPSAHDHYSAYYDDELVDLVYRHEQAIIDEFGYEFDRR